MTRKRGIEREFQKNRVNYLWQGNAQPIQMPLKVETVSGSLEKLSRKESPVLRRHAFFHRSGICRVINLGLDAAGKTLCCHWNAMCSGEQGRDAEICRVNYLWVGTCLCVRCSQRIIALIISWSSLSTDSISWTEPEGMACKQSPF